MSHTDLKNPVMTEEEVVIKMRDHYNIKMDAMADHNMKLRTEQKKPCSTDFSVCDVEQTIIKGKKQDEEKNLPAFSAVMKPLLAEGIVFIIKLIKAEGIVFIGVLVSLFSYLLDLTIDLMFTILKKICDNRSLFLVFGITFCFALVEGIPIPRAIPRSIPGHKEILECAKPDAVGEHGEVAWRACRLELSWNSSDCKYIGSSNEANDEFEKWLKIQNNTNLQITVTKELLNLFSASHQTRGIKFVCINVTTGDPITICDFVLEESHLQETATTFNDSKTKQQTNENENHQPKTLLLGLLVFLSLLIICIVSTRYRCVYVYKNQMEDHLNTRLIPHN